MLAGTVEWMIRLNVLPGILGGGRWLKQQTEAELNTLRAHIDQGQVWPVGLVGDTLSAWDQHQVLVYGYQDRGALCDLFVYDPNSPHQETGLPTTVLTVDRSLATNVEITGSSLTAAIGKVVGLFCSNYAPGAVPALAADFGEFISEPSGFVQRVWGVRFPLPNAAEVVALGGNPATVRANVPVPDPPGRGSPRDSIMLRDRSIANVFIFAGGARFLVPPHSSLRSGAPPPSLSFHRRGLPASRARPRTGHSCARCLGRRCTASKMGRSAGSRHRNTWSHWAASRPYASFPMVRSARFPPDHSSRRRTPTSAPRSARRSPNSPKT